MNPTDRPGTVLDHRFTSNIIEKRGRKRIDVGTLDEANRVYQFGVSLTSHVWWKENLMAFGLAEWSAVDGRCDRLEFTDLATGKCWVADAHEAARQARAFSGPIGQRIGVPFALFTVDESLSKPRSQQPKKAAKEDAPAVEQGSLL